MRKVLSLLMVCAILSSCFLTVNADTVEGYKDKTSQTATDELDGSYEQYLSQFNDFSDSNSNIEVFTSKGNNILLSKENASATFEIDVAEAGFYQPEFTYKAIAGNGTNIKLGLKIDGKSPMELFENFELKRAWCDDTEGASVDDLGNEFSPEQKEAFIEQTSGIFDINGFYIQELKLALQQGKHTVEIYINSQAVELINITFNAPDVIKSYEEVKKEYEQNGYENYSGDAIVIEGEAATLKSSSMILPLVDRNSPDVQPNNPFLDTVNYIGGSNWKDNGDTITWEINIEAGKAGLYDLNFHFKQTYLQESSSYRTLLIDGKCPFEEASNIEFKYASGWQYCSITEKNNTPIYLSEGKHTISLRVTLGELSQFANELKTVVSKTGDVYRDIVMITGETPDTNRDYNLFVQLPDLEKELTEISTTLDRLA